MVQGLMSASGVDDRDRDPTGRPRNARARDGLGRPLARDADGPPASDPPALAPAEALALAQSRLDSGQPFAAHEVFEAVWKATTGPDRELWRGLAQIAVGATHALRGNESGARTLLQRGADSMAAFATTVPNNIDVDGIRRWAHDASNDLALVARPPRLTVAASASGGEGTRASSLGE
jgi:uncharacterized protein